MELEAGPRAHSHLTARFSMKNRRQKHRKYVIYSNETSVLLNALQEISLLNGRLNLYCVFIWLQITYSESLRIMVTVALTHIIQL